MHSAASIASIASHDADFVVAIVSDAPLYLGRQKNTLKGCYNS